MFKPDFGELQLQQLFNNELTIKFPTLGLQPVIPTPHEEHFLGWDTGFYVPGLKLPDPSQKNCNLFLQYKLSELIVGRQGKQYHYWQQPYLRFYIPHWKNLGHPRGSYPDFDQYNALKNLANNGFTTFYVSNHTVDLTELLSWATNGVIIDMNPALDIGHINESHIYATFTSDSDHYFLDTQREKVSKTSLEILKEIILRSKKTSLKEDINIIPELLIGSEIFKRSYQSWREQIRPQTIESEWLLLRYVIYHTLGAVWWKLLT